MNKKYLVICVISLAITIGMILLSCVTAQYVNWQLSKEQIIRSEEWMAVIIITVFYPSIVLAVVFGVIATIFLIKIIKTKDEY